MNDLLNMRALKNQRHAQAHSSSSTFEPFTDPFSSKSDEDELTKAEVRAGLGALSIEVREPAYKAYQALEYRCDVLLTRLCKNIVTGLTLVLGLAWLLGNAHNLQTESWIARQFEPPQLVSVLVGLGIFLAARWQRAKSYSVDPIWLLVALMSAGVGTAILPLPGWSTLGKILITAVFTSMSLYGCTVLLLLCIHYMLHVMGMNCAERYILRLALRVRGALEHDCFASSESRGQVASRLSHAAFWVGMYLPAACSGLEKSDRQWVQQHFQGVANRLSELSRWATVPVETTRKDIANEIDQLIKCVATGRWGDAPYSQTTVRLGRRIWSDVIREGIIAVLPLGFVSGIDLSRMYRGELQIFYIAAFLWAIVGVLRMLDPKVFKENLTTLKEIRTVLLARD